MAEYDFNFHIVKVGNPIITLSAFGIAFNQLSQDLLENPEFIMIGFDSKSLVIGIRAYDGSPDTPYYAFKGKAHHGWVRIGCKDFMRYLKSLTPIDFLNRGKQFIAEYDAFEKTLIVHVDETHLKKTTEK